MSIAPPFYAPQMNEDEQRWFDEQWIEGLSNHQIHLC
jgi:hypothetical protein